MSSTGIHIGPRMMWEGAGFTGNRPWGSFCKWCCFVYYTVQAIHSTSFQSKDKGSLWHSPVVCGNLHVQLRRLGVQEGWFLLLSLFRLLHLEQHSVRCKSSPPLTTAMHHVTAGYSDNESVCTPKLKCFLQNRKYMMLPFTLLLLPYPAVIHTFLYFKHNVHLP